MNSTVKCKGQEVKYRSNGEVTNTNDVKKGVLLQEK